MSDFRDRFLFVYMWPVIAGVVLVVLAGFQLFRVNAPTPEPPKDERFHATEGAVMDGSYTVPANNFLAIKMDFNHRVKFSGRFRTASPEMQLACVVLDAGNFERWKSGAEYKSLAQTKVIPGGNMSLTIEPGTYYLILDNRRTSSDLPIEAHFNVD